jgi:hypothetical protein
MKQFGFEKLDSEDEAELPVNAQKAKDIKFKTNKKGHLILPQKSDFKLLKMRQRVVRGYIGAVYSQYIRLFF